MLPTVSTCWVALARLAAEMAALRRRLEVGRCVAASAESGRGPACLAERVGTRAPGGRCRLPMPTGWLAAAGRATLRAVVGWQQQLLEHCPGRRWYDARPSCPMQHRCQRPWWSTCWEAALLHWLGGSTAPVLRHGLDCQQLVLDFVLPRAKFIRNCTTAASAV